jgi:hypothetical protein
MQELKQCTVDEIFTLLEPYLKLPEATAREMAVMILQTALKTFLKSYSFQARERSLEIFNCMHEYNYIGLLDWFRQ